MVQNLKIVPRQIRKNTLKKKNVLCDVNVKTYSQSNAVAPDPEERVQKKWLKNSLENLSKTKLKVYMTQKFFSRFLGVKCVYKPILRIKLV